MKHLKEHLTRVALLIILAMLPQLASAYSDDYYCAYDFKADGLCYNFNADGTSVEVTYECQYYQYDEWSGELVLSNNYGYINLGGDIVIPKTVNYNGNTYSVTSIGDCAFYNCSGLTSVTIGNSVTSIGNNAFYNCTGLMSIVVESGNTKYDSRNNCNAIIETETNTLITGCKNTIIPNSVTSIGYEAFYYCSGLTSVTIPNSVTSIGGFAFYGCSGLTSVTIGNSVTSIGGAAFYGCSGLTEVTIPESLTMIGGASFVNCSNLRFVNWNAINCSITDYYNRVSYKMGPPIGGVYSEFSNSPFFLGWYDESYGSHGGIYEECGFESNHAITSFIIGDEVEMIPSNLFKWLEGLTSLVVDSDNARYDSRNNCNAIIETGTNTLIAGCKNTIIPNSVSSIGNDAFYGCTGMTSVTIPNSVTSIGSYAFAACQCLDTVYSRIREPQNVNYGDYFFCTLTYTYDYYVDYYYDDAQFIFIDDILSYVLYVPHGKRDIYEQFSWGGYDSDIRSIIEMDPTGDVNDDGTVNVTDYVATAGYILEMDPQPFYFEECDFDDNGTISVGDLVGVANRVLSFEGAPMLAPVEGITEEPSLTMSADVKERNGQYAVSINLSNNIDLTAFQMDLNLPAGMTLVDASLSDRASASHQVAFNQLGNGDYRLLASSPACKAFSGNDGVVLTLTLAGEPSGNGIIRNIEFATPRATSYKARDIELNFETTGVETVKTSNARIYSDGINIIIDSPTASTAQIILPNGMTQTVTVTAGKNIFPAPASGVIIVKMGDSIKKLSIK